MKTSTSKVRSLITECRWLWHSVAMAYPYFIGTGTKALYSAVAVKVHSWVRRSQDTGSYTSRELCKFTQSWAGEVAHWQTTPEPKFHSQFHHTHQHPKKLYQTVLGYFRQSLLYNNKSVHKLAQPSALPKRLANCLVIMFHVADSETTFPTFKTGFSAASRGGWRLLPGNEHSHRVPRNSLVSETAAIGGQSSGRSKRQVREPGQTVLSPCRMAWSSF